MPVGLENKRGCEHESHEQDRSHTALGDNGGSLLECTSTVSVEETCVCVGNNQVVGCVEPHVFVVKGLTPAYSQYLRM